MPEHFLQWYLVGKYLRSKTGMFMTFLIFYLYRELVFDWPGLNERTKRRSKMDNLPCKCWIAHNRSGNCVVCPTVAILHHDIPGSRT